MIPTQQARILAEPGLLLFCRYVQARTSFS